MRTTVHLPDDLFARAKKKAAADGRTLTSLIEEGLRSVLAKPTGGAKARRTLPRVSTATGGLRPGIDPVKANAEMDLIDDVEMMERVARQRRKGS